MVFQMELWNYWYLNFREKKLVSNFVKKARRVIESRHDCE